MLLKPWQLIGHYMMFKTKYTGSLEQVGQLHLQTTYQCNLCVQPSPSVLNALEMFFFSICLTKQVKRLFNLLFMEIQHWWLKPERSAISPIQGYTARKIKIL